MILEPGMLIKLPSGNIVWLIGLEAGEWLCECVQGTASGTVYFTHGFLMSHGKEVPHAASSPKVSDRQPNRRVSPSR